MGLGVDIYEVKTFYLSSDDVLNVSIFIAETSSLFLGSFFIPVFVISILW